MTHRDFRVICDCQRHAIRERSLWRRAVRQVRRGGVALLLGVPLAFGASEAMDAVSAPPQKAAASSNEFHIFTTPRVRREFLTAPEEPSVLTITPEVTREMFFRTKVPYGSIIYREALRNHLQPELVAAVVSAESDFRPKLISGKNAQGLMQLIPSTGRLLGVNDPFDPESNVAAGAKYLRYLMDRFEDPRVAIAAYNAGEGNVEKFGGVPPFPETRAYIQRVDAQTREYRDQVRATHSLTANVRTAYLH